MGLKDFRRSVSYAWRGIRTVAREEPNFRIQLVAATAVLALALWLRVRPIEAAILSLVTACVLVLELLNSVLERVVDAVKPRLSPYVAEVKNIAAGAVLVAAIGAVAVALFIFVPHFLGTGA